MSFILIVVPVFIILSVGFIGQNLLKLDIKSISTAALYLMLPFLALQTFYENELNMDYLYILLFCLLLLFGLILVSFIAGRMTNRPQSKTSAFVLAGAFMNSGNYGVPVILFAFGETGFQYAVIMMVIQSLLMNTVGLYFAAKGSKSGGTLKASLIKILKMPVLYGSIAGILLQIGSVSIPDFIYIGLDLIASAAIPTIMLVLGMQLASISKKNVELKELSGVIFIRLVISPVIAYAITVMLSLDTLLASVLIVLAAMPTAANTTMFAVQFDTEPDLVSFSTLVTTSMSIITVPLMVMLLS
ncbi:AEC family transporter [Rossellomorea vietnamensis]|uniref:AEC family transporter n=2 Tax=Rossellomorea TaxID=2837508 RepID=A0A5D4KFN0_9BACI|nr:MULTISPECIES: AEC family transporter [Rossellomorea]TYR75073.1 AEC family transporter [Rossellomorea vietnamensis]TYS79829.1 AEC family transporter [Rossellomorea aquimaris]